MHAKTVFSADGRSWAVRRNIEWKEPVSDAEFEHDVDAGWRGVLVIFFALIAFWAALIGLLYFQSLTHVPWYLYVLSFLVVPFLFVRWLLRRQWTLVAETSGGYDKGEPEHWAGTVRGRARAKAEMKVITRSLRTRATPSYADSPLRRIR